MPLSALDVSNFDIKGIKLGMNKSEVLKKMPCSSPEIFPTNEIGSLICSTMIRCYKKKNDNFFAVELDHNGKVYSVNKRISFEVKPNLKKIEKKLISKYGQSNIRAKKTPSYSNNNKGYYKEYCWGDKCKKKILNNKYFKGSEIKSSGYISLLVTYSDFYITDSGTLDNQIEFTLRNLKQSNKNYDWIKKQEQLYQAQQKEKASNIDF